MISPKPPTAKFIDSLTKLISEEIDPTRHAIYTQMLNLARAAFTDICDLEEQFDRRIADIEQDLKYNR